MTCTDPPPTELVQGVAQFNAREFYECHETLEAIWLREPGDLRRLYQGILQVGVAFYHLGRGNYRGATSLLETGITYLRAFGPECMGVDVKRLVADAIAAYRELLRLGPEHKAEFDQGLTPVIEWKKPPE